MEKKIEKSIPWVMIVVWLMVLLGGQLISKEAVADTDIRSVTVGNATPTMGTIVLNGGSAINLTENVTTTVLATTTVSDTDSYTDISLVEGKIFRSGVGTSCTANDNYCYSDSLCTTSSCSGNSCVATCEYEVWFHADPTDAGTYSTQYWEALMSVIDTSSASSTATSSGQEMNTLRALDISTATATFGADSADFGSGETGSARRYATGGKFTTGATAGTVNSVTAEIWSSENADRYFQGGIYDLDGDVITNGKTATSTVTTTWSGYTAVTFSFEDPKPTLTANTEYLLILLGSGGLAAGEGFRYATNGGIEYKSGYTIEPLADSYVFATTASRTYHIYATYEIDFSYGNLDPGSTTGAVNQTTTVTASGNEAIDIYLYGADMESSSRVLPVGWQSYSTSNFNYATSYEDFTAYTEYDPNSHVTTTATRTTHDNWHNEETWAYYDYGANHFSAFEHLIDVECTYAAGNRTRIFWALANQIDDNIDIWNVENDDILWINYWGEDFGLRMNEGTGGSSNNDTYSDAAVGTTYYLKIIKSGTNFYCEVYSDSARANLLDTLSLTLNSDYYFQYLYSAQSWEIGSVQHADGWGENLDLGLGGTPLTNVTSTEVELDLSKPTAHSPNTSTDDIYWGMRVSSGQAPGDYKGTTTFESKAD